MPLLLALVVALAMVAAFVWQGYRFWQSETSASPIQWSAGGISADAGPTTPIIDLASVPLFGDATQVEEAPEPNREPESGTVSNRTSGTVDKNQTGRTGTDFRFHGTPPI